MRFGAGWLSAGVAALLLATGCKENRSVTVDERGNEQASASAAVEQAQERSEKAFGQAESTQKEAGDQQQEAARAQQRVEEARRELTQAETQAQKELQQAQQAQQQAQQTQQQAQQTVAEAQRSALEAQQQQQTEQARQAQQPVAQAPVPSAPMPSARGQGEQFIVGQVLTASEDEVMVSVRGEPQLRLQVEPSTQIIVDGRQGRAADIQEGSQVRASYRDSEGEQKAVRIEVTSSAKPGMPVTPESGESTPGVQPPPLEQ